MRSLLRRGRFRAHRPRLGVDDRWEAYLTEVEPTLLSRPRVHRFAQVPVIIERSTAPLPLAVWIEGEGAAASFSRDMLAAGTRAPAAVLGGSLADAMARTRASHVVLLRAGDSPAPLALERLGQAAELAPDAAVITCDDDLLEGDGGRSSPRLRPGPSPDRWLACDDSGPLLVVRREGAESALSDLADSAAWRHELALALAGPASEAHAHVPLLLCHRGATAGEPPSLEPSVVARYAGTEVEADGAVRRVRRAISGEPSVEVVICFRDKPELLARCVVSLLRRTEYERVSIALVDNGSSESSTAALTRGLERDSRVRLLRDERPFNFAALNNLAASSSVADVLVFLNNDTEIVDENWLGALLGEAVRPEVGAVAPMLLYPDGVVQHAGAALGLHDYAGHPFAGLAPNAETAFGRAAQGTRNWLAVTAACMMVQREKFTAVGGFDESFVVAGNDVDLCLRMTAAGHRSLCVPHAIVIHEESRSRGAHIDPGDFVASQERYGAFRTVGDPFYNPSLTLRATDCTVRSSAEALP